jgi:MoxR-like ATPase
LNAKDAKTTLAKISELLSKVIIGERQSRALELILTAIVADGHVLVEDLPGTGKTTAVKALSKIIDCKFRRIQFTPDLLPSDLTGFSIFNQKSGEFEIRPGALFGSIILADEINRASPRTQAGLLQAMEERQVTIDSRTFLLKSPFIILATQNPNDQIGAYKLPESLVDRFMLKVSFGYPTEREEAIILHRHLTNGYDLTSGLDKIIDANVLTEIQKIARSVKVPPQVLKYIAKIGSDLREAGQNVSTRATVALLRATQAAVLFKPGNQFYADIGDVQTMAEPALSHRLKNFDVKSVISNVNALGFYEADQR